MLLTLTVIMTISQHSNAQDTTPIVTEGVIEAPIESVWLAWTTSKGLRSWLAPHVEIDLKIGGVMRTNYNPEGTLGDEQTIENTILAYEPRRMLSIMVTKAPEQFPFPNAIYNMWTVMYFESLDSSKTRMRVVGMGFDLSEESQNMPSFFQRGNLLTIQQIQRHYSPAR